MPEVNSSSFAQSVSPSGTGSLMSHMTRSPALKSVGNAKGFGGSPDLYKPQLGNASSTSGQNQPSRTHRPLDFRNSRMDNILLKRLQRNPTRPCFCAEGLQENRNERRQRLS